MPMTKNEDLEFYSNYIKNPLLLKKLIIFSQPYEYLKYI